MMRTPSPSYSITLRNEMVNQVGMFGKIATTIGERGGDIGPEAALPVMEGKAMLFKEFANIDAFPICLSTKDPVEIIRTVINISPVFGGINLVNPQYWNPMKSIFKTIISLRTAAA